MGNLELALSESKLTSELKDFLDSSFSAAQRGAMLTQRLLAFSRKQMLQPEVVDLRKLVKKTEELVRRTLRENIDIEIIAGARLWRCEVDPGQLENALLNLAINASDAMPDGGKLTIETSNAYLDEQFESSQFDVVTGQYVLLAVSDTGSGMSKMENWMLVCNSCRNLSPYRSWLLRLIACLLLEELGYDKRFYRMWT